MGRLSRNWFVLGASGGISLCMKMETYYQKNYVKEKIIEQSQPWASIPSAYEIELNPEEKENILKDIYNSVRLFYRLVYESKRMPNRTSKEH